jgi:crotonobetainyl-CoA:carnitine CoA-transferase CaiB-like acyl-CoA transferase
MIAHIDHSTIGALRVLGVPVKLSDTPGDVRTPPPLLGQHTNDVLRNDLGLDANEIERLRAQRVI